MEDLGLHRIRLPESEFLNKVAGNTAALAVDFETQTIVYATSEAERLFQCGVENGLDGKQFEELIPGRFHAIHRRHIEEFKKNPRRRAMGTAEKPLWAMDLRGRDFRVAITLLPVQKIDRLYVILTIMPLPDGVQ